MRATLAILTGALFLTAASGCGTPEPARELVIAPPQYPDPALLFDRRPGYPTAEEMGRSSWPNTDSLYLAGERVFYRETIFDLQGPWSPSRDFTYRRFQMVRLGGGGR